MQWSGTIARVVQFLLAEMMFSTIRTWRTTYARLADDPVRKEA